MPRRKGSSGAGWRRQSRADGADWHRRCNARSQCRRCVSVAVAVALAVALVVALIVALVVALVEALALDVVLDVGADDAKVVVDDEVNGVDADTGVDIVFVVGVDAARSARCLTMALPSTRLCLARRSCVRFSPRRPRLSTLNVDLPVRPCGDSSARLRSRRPPAWIARADARSPAACSRMHKPVRPGAGAP
jgi:hypothetical protein